MILKMVGKLPHPSGYPVKILISKGLSIPRVPYNEPLTPGLRRNKVDTTAIGFTHNLLTPDFWEPDSD
jgi:hypothetical protein